VFGLGRLDYRNRFDLGWNGALVSQRTEADGDLGADPTGPGHGHGVDAMSDGKTASAGDFTRSLSGAIQSHPLPAALIGMGFVWLFSGGKSPIMAGAGSANGSAGAVRGVSDAFSSGASTQRVFSTAQSNIADLMDRQPLVLGAIGLSVGAAMAAALPSTAVEADLMGHASADLQARTREVTAEVTERVADLADGVTAAIATEAGAQGLTPDGLTQSAREASRKVQNVVSKAAERLQSGPSAT
jgi:hypothetical protein